MKAIPRFVAMWFLLSVLTSCTSAPQLTESPSPFDTLIPAQATQPTQAVIPADLGFSTPLVELLREAGLSVLSVQGSVYMAMFQSTDQAAWIKTDKGIVNTVFFVDPAETDQIRITQQPSDTTGRYIYIIQAPPPTLLHDLTIDAAFPLFFAVERGMFMVTNSSELETILKHIFLVQ